MALSICQLDPFFQEFGTALKLGGSRFFTLRLGNLLRESLHRPLGLNDATSGGPDAQRRAANAKRERPEAPWTGQREDRPALNLMDINVYHDPAVRLYKVLQVLLTLRR